MTRYGAVFIGMIAVIAILGLLVEAPRQPTTVAPRTPKADQASPDCRRACGDVRRLALVWARLSGTWDHRSAADQFVRLSKLATPTLATRLRRTARTLSADRGLYRERAGQRGRVVALLIEKVGDRRRILIVTREQPYTKAGPDGFGPRHRVYHGEAQREASGWRMTEWELLP